MKSARQVVVMKLGGAGFAEAKVGGAVVARDWQAPNGVCAAIGEEDKMLAVICLC
jgi:hypothetical protein